MAQLKDIFNMPNTAESTFTRSDSDESTNYKESYRSFVSMEEQESIMLDPMQLNYNIYTGEHFPMHSYIHNTFKYFPSKLQILNVKSSKNLYKYLLSKGFKLIFQKVDTVSLDFDLIENLYNINIHNEYSENVIQSLVFSNTELQCCIDLYAAAISSGKKEKYASKDILNNKDSTLNMEIYYDYNNVSKINVFVKEMRKLLKTVYQPKKTEHKSYIYLLNETEYGLDISPHEINKVELDITKFYNDDFVSVHKLLLNKLTENDISGIAFLHGEHGTGKTTYLRYLVYILKVKCIFIPRDLLHLLATPGFISFLMRYPNSILILEDCGEVIKTINKSSIVPNLLNYSDGILGDILKCKIIVTFNEDIGEIDPRLTRGGRCLINYEFKKLVKEKAKLLNPDITEDSKLCDIFNEKVYTNVVKTKVGFK